MWRSVFLLLWVCLCMWVISSWWRGVCGMKLVYDRRPPRAWREGVISLITKKMGVKAWLRRKRRNWMTTKKVGRDSVIARKIGRGGVIAKKLGVMAWFRKKIGRDGMTDRKLRRDGEWRRDCTKFRREGLIGQTFRRSFTHFFYKNYFLCFMVGIDILRKRYF